MQPSRRDDDVLVDLLDVIVEEGVILEADVLISVAEIPLVGLKLRAALAGLTTMREYGMFEDWDEEHRSRRRERTRLSAAPTVPRPHPKVSGERETRPPLTERPSRLSKPHPESPDVDSVVRPDDPTPDGRTGRGRPREESPLGAPEDERPGRGDGVASRPDGAPTADGAGAEAESNDSGSGDEEAADRRDGDNGQS